MSLQLVIKKELTPQKFAEIGQPYRVFRDEKRGLLAVCSHIASPMHRAKWHHGPGIFEHRVSVYQIAGMVRLGVMACRFQVNHVVFHKTEPVLLASTGSYDGGFFYNGDLLRFDWRKQTRHKMFGGSREVVVARYQDDGKISLLMRPQDEEEFADHEGEDYPNHHEIFVGLVIDDRPFSEFTNGREQYEPDPRLVGLRPCNPADFGFSADQLARQYFMMVKPDVNDLQELLAAGHDARAGVWDLRPLGAGRFAVMMNGRLLEIWDKENGLEARFDGEVDGLEFLHQAGDELLFHVLVRGKPGTAEHTRSQLWKYARGEVSLWKAFDGDYSWCVNGDGWLLGTEGWNGHLARRSLRVSPSGESFPGPEGCGGDRHERLQLLPRGASELHFVRRSGDSRAFDYRLWMLKQTGEELDVGPLGPIGFSDSVEYAMPWDLTRYVQVCDRWAIAAHKSAGTLLELVERDTGRAIFSIPLCGAVTQILRLSGSETVLAGHRDGGLSVVDLKRREVVLEQMMMVDGLVCVPSALAEVAGAIIIGTDDGRLLVACLREPAVGIA